MGHDGDIDTVVESCFAKVKKNQRPGNSHDPNVHELKQMRTRCATRIEVETVLYKQLVIFTRLITSEHSPNIVAQRHAEVKRYPFGRSEHICIMYH